MLFLHSDIYVILQTAVGCVRGGDADHLAYVLFVMISYGSQRFATMISYGFLTNPRVLTQLPSSFSPPPSMKDIYQIWCLVGQEKKDIEMVSWRGCIHTHTHTQKSNIDTQNDAIFGKITYVFQPTIFLVSMSNGVFFQKVSQVDSLPNTNIAGSPLEIGETNH